MNLQRIVLTFGLFICWDCMVQEDGATAKSLADEGKPSANKPAHAGPANRLARETSPYLLLHAHNPVDWYPWGPEAFEKAKREKKPIFLSIGYSSCYWCHVMERKVFSNPEIAKYMNEHYVNIKVDREERPDVDDVYMTALSVYFQLSGQPQGGGWPLSMFLTPDGKPIAGGTYFPPDDEGGRMGFPSVAKKIHGFWTDRRETVLQNAEIVTGHLQRIMKPTPNLAPTELKRETVNETAQALADSYDPQYGGVDFNPDQPNRPKFPVPAKLALLQYQLRNADDEQTGKVVYHTLDVLAAGGIHDHLAGGFHRYSTDRAWQVPHFEKMLYDNAQLAGVYVEAFRQTGNTNYRQVVKRIFTHILRDMTDAGGAFYSALDAETDAIEGKYYVWSPQDIDAAMSPEDAQLFKRVYGFQDPQTFEHGYILHLPQAVAEVAGELKMSPASLETQLTTLRAKLLAVRNERESPLRDDKILTSWNGLMIRTLADGGRVLEQPQYIAAAAKAAQFILDNMRDDEGRLLRTYRAQQAKLNAYLDDYAFFVEGLLALHQATQDDKWLTLARELTDDQIKLFYDDKGEGFYFTSHHHEELLARTKNAYDAVLPSGNSVSVRNLIRLAALTGENDYREHAERTLKLFVPQVAQRPQAMTNMAIALGEFLDGAEDTKQSAFVPLPGSEDAGIGEVILVALQDSDKTRKKTPIVTAKAFLSVDKLPPGQKCDILVVLSVAKGWHINTNPAMPDFLVPTDVTIKAKHASKLTAVSYPEGHKQNIAGFEEPIHVYEGEVSIRGLLEIPAAAAGETEEMQIVVRYQACNDMKCLAPTSVKLNGKVPIAKAGEMVKKVNQDLFNPPKKKTKS